VTEGELNAYLAKNTTVPAAEEGYKISLIVIKKTEDPKQSEEKARTIYEEIRAGEGFADAARKYSEDSSAKVGGDLGFVSKTDLSKEFLDVLAKLKPGAVSEPFSTAGGINIMKLESEKIFKNPAELRQAMQDKLYAERFERDYKAWVKGLRQKAYVEIK
jgi:peptidyl-prolyl cis-trans isomerase SurA